MVCAEKRAGIRIEEAGLVVADWSNNNIRELQLSIKLPNKLTDYAEIW